MAQRYNHCGTLITHDAYAPGMAEKYGMPGTTDNEGFDPYRDTVGAGIYGGIVKRDETGAVLVGRQYQNHNSRPGPVYAGGGYTPVNEALRNIGKLNALLDKYPDLVNDISTGGANPLHMCGMSAANQHAVTVLARRGADIEALETYGMTPLHRMASNNLAVGAELLLQAGADPNYKGRVGITPMEMASQSHATQVMAVLREHSAQTGNLSMVDKLNVMGAGRAAVNGDYLPRDTATEIPRGFALVCEQQGWPVDGTWKKLAGGERWFAHADETNDSYVYWNRENGKWWIDGPDGSGVYIAEAPEHAPPAHGWQLIDERGGDAPVPEVRSFRLV